MAFFLVKKFAIRQLHLNLVKNIHMKMTITHINFFISLFFILVFTNVNSQNQDNPWVISIGVNAVDFYPTNIKGMTSESGNETQWFDQFFNVSDHYNYIKAPSKLSVGKYLNESFNIELAASINQIDKIGNLKLEESISYFAVDLNFNYDLNKIIGNTAWFDPYFILGSGYNSIGTEKSLTLNTGIGTKLWFSKNVGIKLQTAYKHFLNEDSYRNLQHSVSVVLKFGGYDEDNDGVYDKVDKCPTIFGLAEFNGCPDSDEDGIQDSDDACPTVFGIEALNGCPDSDGDGITDKSDKCPYVKGEQKYNGCPDSDGDGVIDSLDACKNRPGPISNKGCPELDSDGDGVIDKLDKCKFESGPISNNGCPDIKKDLEAKLSELANSILFISGSDIFYSKYETELNQIANLMKKHNNLKFQIQGHTDDIGDEESNLKLSLKRVNRILNYLVSKDINQFNLNIQGLGESMPIDTNETPEGRAKNRRVEIKILN